MCSGSTSDSLSLSQANLVAIVLRRTYFAVWHKFEHSVLRSRPWCKMELESLILLLSFRLSSVLQVAQACLGQIGLNPWIQRPSAEQQQLIP